MPKSINNLWLQKSLTIWIWHILLLKCLQKIIRRCLHLIMQEISCLIWPKNIYRAQNLQKQLIASLVQAVLHMLLMPFSIITGHNKLAITGGEIRRFFLPPVLFGE